MHGFILHKILESNTTSTANPFLCAADISLIHKSSQQLGSFWVAVGYLSGICQELLGSCQVAVW